MNYLLTGVSKGLGLEIATCLLREGHCVFGIVRNSTAQLHTLEAEFANSFITIKHDLRDVAAIKETVFGKISELGRPIHGLVSNAALAYDELASHYKYQEVEQMFAVNVLAPIELTKHTIRNMLLHHVPGSLVYVSSISARKGFRGLSMYAATKGAIESFSKNIAREWGAKSIRSNCVVPGFMETDMTSSVGNDIKSSVIGRSALRKMTEISSVVATVRFLLGEESSSITGQDFVVDAGSI